jgi:hypothetical protein
MDYAGGRLHGTIKQPDNRGEAAQEIARGYNVRNRVTLRIAS